MLPTGHLLLVGTVQNWFMPILIPILTKPPRARKRFEQDTRAFIEKYCNDHAAFQRDPAAYYKAQLHEKHPGAARGFGDDGTQPRYFSPYEDGQRFRHTEAVGGYRCAPYGHGVAVRAKGFAPHTSESGTESVHFVAHGASSKPTLPQAAMPGPIKIGGRWEYPESPNFCLPCLLRRSRRSRRPLHGGGILAASVAQPAPAGNCHRQDYQWESRPPTGISQQFPVRCAHVLYPSTELKKERAKNGMLVNRNQSVSSCLRPEDFPDYNPTDAEIVQWRLQYWLKRRKI